MAKEYKITVRRLQDLEKELNYLKTTREREIADMIAGGNPDASTALAAEIEVLTVNGDRAKLTALISSVNVIVGKAECIDLVLDRLDEITAVCNRPLVLHGGSGTPDDQMKTAIYHGITKINIYSDVVAALNKGLKDKLNTMENPATWPFLVFADARSMMKDVARNKLRTFGSAGKL